MKLLIAEDSPVIQSIHRARMKDWGFDFDFASNGEEAVALAQGNQGKYDVCLMDINMPKMNGIEAVQVIRDTVCYFPIMALTSEACHEEASFNAGMDAFMLKSGNQAELLVRIRDLAVKCYRVVIESGQLRVLEAMPVNGQQAGNLRDLAKCGLCKVSFFDNTGRCFTVHKKALVKITHDFEVNGRILSTFLNRDFATPTLCYLFKESISISQILLTEEEYENMLLEEDEVLLKYTDLKN